MAETLLEELAEKGNNFRTVCSAMGGQYDEENGLLEPDVGGEFPTRHVASKEWCTFKNMAGIGRGQVVVFNSPNTFSVGIRDKDGEQLIDLWDNDIKKEFDKEGQQMIFIPRYGIRVPESKISVSTTPLRKYGHQPNKVRLEIEPRD